MSKATPKEMAVAELILVEEGITFNNKQSFERLVNNIAQALEDQKEKDAQIAGNCSMSLRFIANTLRDLNGGKLTSAEAANQFQNGVEEILDKVGEAIRQGGTQVNE